MNRPYYPILPSPYGAPYDPSTAAPPPSTDPGPPCSITTSGRPYSTASGVHYSNSSSTSYGASSPGTSYGASSSSSSYGASHAASPSDPGGTVSAPVNPLLIDPLLGGSGHDERVVWDDTGLRLKPIIFFGLKPLMEDTKRYLWDAIAAISWVQPKSIAIWQWDLGLSLECSTLCHMLRQDPMFRSMKETKYPHVFQLDRKGICWVPKGFLAVAIHLHDKNVDVTMVSFREVATYEQTWPVGQCLFLTHAGFKAKSRLKFAIILLQPTKEQMSLGYYYGSARAQREEEDLEREWAGI